MSEIAKQVCMVLTVFRSRCTSC